MTSADLVKLAFKAAERAYVPYSHFHVGAALLTKTGKIYLGCNIENASYTPTNCAERTAFFKAISEGERDFEAIAIVGGMDMNFTDYSPPCGVCRQVMQEFCDPDFKIYLGKAQGDVLEYTLAEILPLGFTPENLQK